MTRPDHLVLPASVESIPLFRDFVARACASLGASEDEGFALKLAVDEACSNIVEHGYDGLPGGWIELTVEADGTQISVVIADGGRPFRPEDAPAVDVEAGWQERPIGGLGWHLIRRMVDDIHYETSEDGNRLTLVRRTVRPNPEGVKSDGREG